MRHILTAALIFVPVAIRAQTIPPLRSYATSGTETSRYFDAARGWMQSTQTFTGTFDLVTTTDARLTKIYADGTSAVRDLVLQWVVDLEAPTQGGQAAEVPDPTDPLIKRTTYNLLLQYDGLRYIASGTFLTRAWMSVRPGIYDWFNVAYGDFSGFVISPLGDYTISGTEQSGKTPSPYTGVFTLLPSGTARLTRSFAEGGTTIVDVALLSPVDLNATIQTVSAVQLRNDPGQTTTYTLTLQLERALYAVDCTYTTSRFKGKTSRIVSTGSLNGTQP